MNSHLSEKEICRWLAGERGGATEEHLAHCGGCSAEVRRTQAAFQLFRENAYNRASAVPYRLTPGWRHFVPAGCFAAGLILAIFFDARHIPPPSRPLFVQIPYVIPPAPYERTKIVRMDVPVAALVAAGFSVQVTGAPASVRADVLVAQDGRPLALSLVSNRREQ